MPLLGVRRGTQDGAEGPRPASRPRFSPLFPECSNAHCGSGRLHLWRHRRTPVIEGGWVCGPACSLRRLQEAIARELEGYPPVRELHRHRIPLGLILLDQGWIDHGQLKKALRAKREGDPKRIGAWLMQHCGLEEQRVTQALSLQWNCPIFSGEPDSLMLALSPIPRILLDALGVIPLRQAASGSLYVAFEDRIDHSLALAIERITGLPVVAGLLSGSAFRRHHERMLAAGFPRVRLIEASSAETLAPALTQLIEKAQPAQARLVRVDRFLWLRMWKQTRASGSDGDLDNRRSTEDVICSITPFQ
ncbi:MAG TPA: hypothetical protein VGG42_02350 [Acidobacteriaceae bacterium]